jgi:teichoic acid transport system permease protein
MAGRLHQQIGDFIPFLVTGVFIWTLTSNSIMAGTRAISGNLGLVRALHFPRAALPIGLALQQLQQLLFSLGALAVILVGLGEYPGVSWLLALPALTLQALFNTGLTMVMARLAASTPDISQLMPFLLRTWMYMSGVMWSVDKVTNGDRLPHIVGVALECNPAAVYIDLMRFALVDSFTAAQLPPHVWAIALGWALVAGVDGFLFFWKAEEEYGRG